jgi:hypothetical protein
VEANFKVRVLVNYNDIITKEFYTAGTIRYLDYQRAWELVKKEIVKVMEIRKCKYE